MNPIAQGMALGYTGQQLLNFLTKAIPSLSPKINQAQRAGHSIEKIINFLGKTMESQSYPKNMSQNQIHGQKTKEKEAFTKGLLAKGAALVGTGLATAAVSRALPSLASGLIQRGSPPHSPNPNLTPSPNAPIPSTGMSPQPLAQPPQPTTPNSPTPPLIPNAPVQAMPVNSSSQQPPVNQVNPIVPNSQQAMQAEGNSLQTRKIPPLPQALQKQVESMLAAGNDIENIAGTIKATQPQVAKEYEKTTNVAIADAVKQFAETNPVQKGKLSGMGTTPSAENNEIPEEKTSTRPIEKKSVVALPNGDIGEVTDIRQGIATVNASGKQYRKKVEDLIESPLSEKDLADTYQGLLAKIEETTGKAVSRHLDFVGFDEANGALAYKPHGDKLYIYEEIDPEDVEILKSEMNRTTSGENYIGAFSKGTLSPGGSQMSMLIQKYKKRAKDRIESLAKEKGISVKEAQELIEKGGQGYKFEKVYDYLDPAKEALKRKHKKKS